MDELEISGKRYISSKRAAKENRYHVDYIGQLIRTGKIVGSKVGRTWYVEAESLASYLGETYEKPMTPVPPPQVHVPEVKVASVQKKDLSIEQAAESGHTDTKEVDVTEKEPVQHIAITKIGEPHAASTPARIARDEQRYEAPKRSAYIGKLTYLDDDEPLLPQLNKSKEHSIAITRASEEPRERSEPKVRIIQKELRTPVGNKALMVAAVAVGCIAFCGALGVSYFLKSDTTVDTASSYSSVHF